VYHLLWIWKNLYFVNTQCVYISYDYHNMHTLFSHQNEHGMISEIFSQIYYHYFYLLASPLSRNRGLLGWYVATSCFLFSPPNFHYPSWTLFSKDNKIIKFTIWSKLRRFCLVPAVKNEAFLLTFNVQWLAVCVNKVHNITKLAMYIRIKVHEGALASALMAKVRLSEWPVTPPAIFSGS